MKTLVIHFARYGPYHYARLRSAADALAPLDWEVVGLETAGNDATYAWDETRGEEAGPQVITAFPGRVYEEITSAECKRVLRPLLDELKPDAVAIAGWAAADALACLSWCRKNDVRRIVMSETREADGKRVWWKELIKRYLISRFDGALVGGKSHRNYLVKLGMPADRIAFGYNVVDNAYFREACLKVRKSEGLKVREEEIGDGGLGTGDREQDANSSSQLSAFQFSAFTPKYFLSSNRFIERKNLARLIEAYSIYIQKSKFNHHQSSIWHLCLLGDGELKADLHAQCHRLGLHVIESAPWELTSPTSKIENHQSSISNQRSASSLTTDHRPPTSGLVFFPGFRQIDELPRFYANAACFVHPALEEPWGLVLNEAMACGLPILSGDNVGAAEELVDDGVNGWIFDATDVGAMEECLARVSALDEEARAAFGQASERILEARCPTEAFGRGLADLLIAPG